jgi:hypothetical protein
MTTKDCGLTDVVQIVDGALNRMARSFCQSSRTWLEFPERFRFLVDIERSMQALSQNKLDVSSIGESQLAGAEKFLELADDWNSLESVLLNNLIARFRKPAPRVTKAQSKPTPAETNRAEGEHNAPSTDEALNRMARSFSRNRLDLELALRYRTKIERSRDHALHELQRLQAARQGKVVAAPEMVDVKVSFDR